MIWIRLKHLLPSRRRAEERDMQEELDALVQIAGERELGNLTLAAENARETWQWTSLDAVVADVRYAFRGLRKNPGFAAVAITTLAVGIGANTAIFSVVNSLFLRPLPVQDPYRLVVLAPRERGSSEFHDLSYPDYRDYRAHAGAFSDMLGFAVGMDGIAVDQGTHQVLTSYVTGNYFSMLGVRPALGRFIEPAEAETPGAAPVLVLGYTCWQRQFNSDPGVIGKSARLNGHAVMIVGVAPEQFHGTFSLAETDAYLPVGMLAIEDSSFWTARGKRELRAIARLKPGMSLKQGRASLQVIARSLAEQYPDTNKYTSMEAYPEWRARPQPDSAGSWPAMVGIFLTLAFIVLLVACVNLASILRARGNARESEMAVRSALGAARGRLVRQLLTENVLLAIVGGAAGILLSTWISMVLSSICTPIDLPMVRLNFRPDWRVFAYAFGVALLAGLMVGLGPMRSAWRSNLSIVLHEGGRALSGSRRRNRRNVLVVTQVAASMVLLIAAGLLVRSLEGAQRMNLGFDPHHLLNLSMDLHQIGYDESRGKNFYGELLARARALPGVESAAFVFSVPFFHDRFLSTVHIEGRPLSPGAAPSDVSYNVIDPALFQTLRIPILRGRGFNEADNETAPPVAIVSQAMAERFWPGQDPVGKRFRITKPTNPLLEVVGVARNAKFVRPTPEAEPYFYVPLSQNYTARMTLQVRSSRPAEALEREVLHEIRALAPDLPTYDVRTMEESLGGTMGFFLFRVGADLAAGLGILALFLTIVGVYGVSSYAASQRTHEIGLRMALGATGQDILRMVLGEGLRLIGTGVLIGLGIALAVSRAISSLLVGVSASDPMTYTAVSALLGGLALVAGYMPARRAMRVDVMVALRHE